MMLQRLARVQLNHLLRSACLKPKSVPNRRPGKKIGPVWSAAFHRGFYSHESASKASSFAGHACNFQTVGFLRAIKRGCRFRKLGGAAGSWVILWFRGVAEAANVTVGTLAADTAQSQVMKTPPMISKTSFCKIG
jgi:hypothetical protein